jgi:hypothetical protein
MKLNFKLTITALLIGIIAFGQDSKSTLSFSENENMASNQSQFETENNILNTLKDQDSTKAKAVRDVPWFVDRYRISLGFYAGNNNTNIQLNSTSGNIGTEIDFENDLGFNSYSSSIFADFHWRSTSRSRFLLGYYNLRRDTNKKLEKKIEFGDNPYEIGVDIYSYFNAAIYRFSYGYAIFSKPKYEVGLSIGTHIINMEAGIGIKGANISTEVNDNFGVTAPLPDFGIWGGYAFSERFALNAEFDYFAITIGNIKGQVVSYNISATYKLSKHFNITGAFNSLNTNVDRSGDLAYAKVEWGNNGFSLRAAYTFGNKKWQ